MSVKLRELIRLVRQCKTAAEERAVVAKECAAIRNAFKQNDVSLRHRNVAKLLFIHMLGYPTHFGQMECLKLISGVHYPEKRIGYLGLTLLMDEKQEVLMLVTNSLKNDLNSKNQFIIGLALCALGNIASAEMCRDLAPEVERLLGNSSAFVRKKAALCCIRIIKKVPELLENIVEPSMQLLRDRHHGVLVASMQLFYNMLEASPELVPKFRAHVNDLVRVLKSLVLSGFTPDHDVSGLTDPFLQIKTLRLLRVLAAGDTQASDQMSDILAQVATNIEGSKNAGNAVLYECVQTIMGVESIGGLRVLAINILGRFLANRDNNIRYVALNMLAKVVAVDTKAVQRHRNTIVNCVKDSDVSIRRRALDLVYALVNENNITTLTKELIEYLVVSDMEFKADLTDKICSLVNRYAPDKRWHIDTLTQVLSQAGAFAKSDQARWLVILISNAPNLQAYAVRKLYRLLFETRPHKTLLMVIVWCIGEYGDVLIRGGELQKDELPLSVTPKEVLSLFSTQLREHAGEGTEVREMLLTALVKLSSRLPDSDDEIKKIIEQYRGSVHLEVQQRACEYSKLFSHNKIRPGLLEQMPPLAEETSVSGQLDDAVVERSAAPELKSTAAGVSNTNTVPTPTTAAAADPMGDLLNMDLLDASNGDAAPPSSAAATDLLADLLGGDPTSPPPSDTAGQSAPPHNTADALAELLGGVPSSTPVAPANPLANIMNAYGNTPVGMYGFGNMAAAPPPMQTPPPATFPPFVAFHKGNLTVSFVCSKPQPGNPSVTLVTGHYTNSGSIPISDFVLQAAVPTVMQLVLSPASSNVIPPNNSGAIMQNIQVSNSMHGQKSLVMRLKIAYKIGGNQCSEEATVNTFPQGC